jgi:hypothetical protein
MIRRFLVLNNPFGAQNGQFNEMAGWHDSEDRKKSSFRSETGASDHGTFTY